MSHDARINNEEYFKELRQTPFIAWPTFIMLVIGLTAIAFTWWACMTQHLPLWVGAIINGWSMYLLFSPAHDAMHRAVSSNERLNNFVLFLSAQPGAPGATGRAFRILHMQHHRFANEHVNDPDHHVASNLWNIFTTWFFWDLMYVLYFFKHRTELPEQARRQIWLDIVLGYGAVGVLAWFFPWQTLFLWFLPSRFSAWMICLTFMYLPHYPHGVAAKDDPYKATTIRQGWEWLLSPLLACQNYHLVHHLYPTVPFYRYRKVWLARKDFHESKNPAIVPAFGLRHQPDNRPQA